MIQTEGSILERLQGERKCGTGKEHKIECTAGCPEEGRKVCIG